jgi:3-oxoacyl-(acyl-carrier-protein) synthase
VSDVVSKRLVVITGLGGSSSLGHNSAQFWNMLSQGIAGIGLMEGVDPAKIKFGNGAQVRNYRVDDYFYSERARFLDRFAQFGLIATQEAVQAAGIDWLPFCGRMHRHHHRLGSRWPGSAGRRLCGTLSAWKNPPPLTDYPAHHG